MFGIPLGTLITLALTYGPKIIAIIQALEPVIKVAEPLIADLVAKGATHEEATFQIFGGIADQLAANGDAAIRAQGTDNG